MAMENPDDGALKAMEEFSKIPQEAVEITVEGINEDIAGDEVKFEDVNFLDQKNGVFSFVTSNTEEFGFSTKATAVVVVDGKEMTVEGALADLPNGTKKAFTVDVFNQEDKVALISKAHSFLVKKIVNTSNVMSADESSEYFTQ